MNKKIIVILCFSLFLSLAYNFHWVVFERSNNSNTIHKLNTYIEKSKNLVLSMNELNKKTGEYADLATDSLLTCDDGDMVTAENNARKLSELRKEIEAQKIDVSKILEDRTSFANQSGLKVTYEKN